MLCCGARGWCVVGARAAASGQHTEKCAAAVENGAAASARPILSSADGNEARADGQTLSYASEALPRWSIRCRFASLAPTHMSRSFRLPQEAQFASCMCVCLPNPCLPPNFPVGRDESSHNSRPGAEMTRMSAGDHKQGLVLPAAQRRGPWLCHLLFSTLLADHAWYPPCHGNLAAQIALLRLHGRVRECY